MSTLESRTRWMNWALWAPGLLVALGAGVATAHGLFEVAASAQVPNEIAWIYPLITDGLALVAYIATARLTGSGRAYAWFVVVLAAGLSGLAQAVYLAGGVETAPPELRFGVGAWPAVAAAIVAHLLFLLGTHTNDTGTETSESTTPVSAGAELVRPEPAQPVVQPVAVDARVQPSEPVQPPVTVQPSPEPVQPRRDAEAESSNADSESVAASAEPRPAASVPSPARDAARAAARRHHAHHGTLPTVAQLMDLAQVSRGTAGTALKELRDQPAPLHLIHEASTTRTQA